MSSTQVKRPVLRYHGGKFLLGKWTISHFPDHRNYTESMGGAGSVLMLKPRAYAEVYNDKWDLVVNVFRVLRDPVQAQQLKELLFLTPFSRSEYTQAFQPEQLDGISAVELARRTIFRSFASFGSAGTNPNHKTGFRANNRHNGTNCAKDWLNYPKHIASFCERLQGVVIENRDYREILEQQDSPDTLHYLDPPYVGDTRKLSGKIIYQYEFSDQDHIDMAEKAKVLSGMVVIAGYKSDLYNDLFKGWHTVYRKALADGASARVECLWISPSAARKIPQQLFHTTPE